jgi:hypothetical protein
MVNLLPLNTYSLQSSYYSPQIEAFSEKEKHSVLYVNNVISEYKTI